jgi:fatty acid synthase subunit beta, fungi type
MPLTSITEKVNAHFKTQDQVVVALVNSSKSLIVSGSHRALRGVQNLLDNMKASSNLNESRVHYTNRDPIIEYTFLPISAPFHSPALSAVKDEVFAVAVTDTSFGTLCLGMPVYDTCSGRNIQFTSGWLLAKALISMILTEPVDWPKAGIQKDISHILDFGPG